MSVPQFIISLPLFFFLAFGLAFIINMLLKTTWVPGYLYVAVMLVSVIAVYFRNNGSVAMLHPVDVTVLLSGLAGAFTGGWTIRLLRRKGYRMF